ncbi:MAG: AI-2E family transporter [Phycisphaerales bacterium]|nr:AI-2E family transporter [Phycisphaerales bacterium]
MSSEPDPAGGSDGQEGPSDQRPLADRHLWEIRPLRDIMIVLIVAIVLWLGYAFRDVTVPLLVALLLAYLFEPVIAWMTRARWIPFGRTGAVSVLLTTIVIGMLAGLALVVPQVIEQTVSVVESVEDGTARRKLTALTESWVPQHLQPDILDLVDELPSGEDEQRDARGGDQAAAGSTSTPSDPSTEPFREGQEHRSLSDRLAAQSGDLDLWGLAGRTSRIAMSVVHNSITVGLLVFLIPFYFFFFSLWYPRVARFVDSMIPDRSRPTVEPLLHKFDRAVAGFVRGRLFIAFIMGLLFALGWGLIGVPYAILLSVVTAVLCLVPFVSIITLPIAIGLLAAAELDLPEAQRMSWLGILIWPSLVFTVIQLLDGWVLQPIIYGKTTDLDPVTIFVAILAGGSVLGIYGMLIAIPVAACVKILLVDLVIPKLRELAARPAG